MVINSIYTMLRKIIAVLVTLITIWAIKETFFIFTTSQTDIAAGRHWLILASLSITVPLIIACFWLWKPKYKGEDNEPR